MDLLIFEHPILIIQALMDGVLLGILFALIAYGMALQWGVMNIINIAQGELVIMGGYVAYFLYMYGIHPAYGVIVSPIVMYFVGIGIYKLVINDEFSTVKGFKNEFGNESKESTERPRLVTRRVC